MGIVKIKDKSFKVSIPEAEIKSRVKAVAEQINKDLAGKNPLFLCVLNGSFIFAADLYREITIPSNISFVKLASYQGTISMGKVQEVIGLNEDISGRTIVIVEDIIDTGRTLNEVKKYLESKGPLSLRIVTLLDKPDRRVVKLQSDYSLFTIPDYFVIGYGLDYSEYYRNLPYIGEYSEI